jgi:hypothetical protein
MTANEGPVRVLPPSEVDALLCELQALITNLPPSLPLVVDISESRYGALVGFSPDPELVEDIGEVGAVNTALERMFGHRMDGLKILERGTIIEAIVPLLEGYLKRFQGDIILQKWLADFVSGARALVSAYMDLLYIVSDVGGPSAPNVSSSLLRRLARQIKSENVPIQVTHLIPQ